MVNEEDTRLCAGETSPGSQAGTRQRLYFPKCLWLYFPPQKELMFPKKGLGQRAENAFFSEFNRAEAQGVGCKCHRHTVTFRPEGLQH